jgi:hypothetical protein
MDESNRTLLSVRQFSEKHPAFTPQGLRHLIFCSEERELSKGKLPGNGLKESGAILRCGRKVVIDEARFFGWLDAKNGLRTAR